MVELVCPHCKRRGKSVKRGGEKLVGKGYSRQARQYLCQCGHGFTTHEVVIHRQAGIQREVTPEMAAMARALKKQGFSWLKIGKAMDVHWDRIRYAAEKDQIQAQRRARGPDIRQRDKDRSRFYRKREECREEAAGSGIPVLELYKASGVLLPKDLAAA